MTNQPRTVRPRKMVRRSILLALAVITATFGIGLAEPEAERVADAAPQAAAPAVTTLVLYDSTGPYAWLGDIYAVQTANLAGHFGTVTRKKVTAYAKGDKVVCFFQGASKFKARYATLGFSDEARLDDGAMWPTSFALQQLGPAEEARVSALVRKAAG